MQKNELNILSTRPLDELLIQKAKDRLIAIDCISFIETAPVKDESIKEQIQKFQDQNITAVFTSMTAVDAVSGYLTRQPHWAIYTIGQTTKEKAAQIFGEENIKATANNASLLADHIIMQQEKEVYFFCGDQRREELPDKLRQANITLHEIVVYTTTQQAKTIEKIYDGILFFSPSAVHSFFSKNTIKEATTLFAIGTTTAGAIRQYTTNQMVIAERPGKEALVEVMIQYFSSIQKPIH